MPETVRGEFRHVSRTHVLGPAESALLSCSSLFSVPLALTTGNYQGASPEEVSPPRTPMKHSEKMVNKMWKKKTKVGIKLKSKRVMAGSSSQGEKINCAFIH